MRRLFVQVNVFSRRSLGVCRAVSSSSGVGLGQRGPRLPPQQDKPMRGNPSHPYPTRGGRSEARESHGQLPPESWSPQGSHQINTAQRTAFQGGRGGRPPKQDYGGGRDKFLSRNAQTLVDLKREYKQAKSLKERIDFLRQARRLVRRTSIDPSTQDEKSVTILLNSAVTFKCRVEENIEQAVQWMRHNLRGLSPQNLALFTNAVGFLSLRNPDKIFLQEIVPVVRTQLEDMTPVEIVMILQAFGRLRVNDEEQQLQKEMLLLLEPCIASMHISELSTLATVLAWHPLKTTDQVRWRALVDSIMQKVMTDLERVHSKEVIAFLTVVTLLQLEQDQLIGLLNRATDTCSFHTAEEVGDLFHALARIHKSIEAPMEAFTHASKKLEKGLLVRLERVARFANLNGIAKIWLHSHACGVEISEALQTQLLQSATEHFSYYQPRFTTICSFAKAAETQKLTSTHVFDLISDYAIGKRPPRPQTDESQIPDIDAEDPRLLTGALLFERFFTELLLLRIYLENIYAANNARPSASLTRVLPKELLTHVDKISPKQALMVVKHIALAPDNELRNIENDEALLSCVKTRIEKEGSKFVQDISSSYLDRIREAAITNRRTQGIAQLLLKAN